MSSDFILVDVKKLWVFHGFLVLSEGFRNRENLTMSLTKLASNIGPSVRQEVQAILGQHTSAFDRGKPGPQQ